MKNAILYQFFKTIISKSLPFEYYEELTDQDDKYKFMHHNFMSNYLIIDMVIVVNTCLCEKEHSNIHL